MPRRRREPENEAGVAYVDMDRMLVVLDTGEKCAITNMIDDDRDETLDPDEAVALVFRIDSSNQWGACER